MTDFEELGGMLERAGIEHITEAFTGHNEIHLPDTGTVFVFANSGALIEANVRKFSA